jgi:hypothetical protein
VIHDEPCFFNRFKHFGTSDSPIRS